jgi:hypothetical protein
MDVNGTMGKNKFKHHRGPLRSWLLAGGLAPGSFGGTWYVLNGSGKPVTSSPSGSASSGGGNGY